MRKLRSQRLSSVVQIAENQGHSRGASLKIVVVFNDRPAYGLMTEQEIAAPDDLKEPAIQ